MAGPVPQRQPYPVAVTRIERFAELEQGWNGHDAAPIARRRRDTPIEFLYRVASEFGSAVPEPTVVAATSDGGVALEWIAKADGEERGIEIVFLPNGSNEYSARNRDERRVLDDGENLDLGFLLLNVIKPHVAGHFVLAR